MNGKQTTVRLRHAIILALGLGISHFAFALRLGPINVKSYLGQPMNATIRVDGLNASSAGATKVQIASADAYRSHGVEMLPIHSQMRFSLVPSGKGYVIHVSSTGSVKEPFVNFLVTVSGNGSTVTREYAAFFNPNPTMTAGKSDKPTVVVEKQHAQPKKAVIAERAAEPAPRSRQSANTSGWGGNSKPVPRKAAPTPAPAAPSQVSGSPNTPASIPVGSTYGPIKPGETLYSIAKAARPTEEMRIYDMMRLIFRANRHAFIGGNMSNMMAGATLRIPNPGDSSASQAPERRPAPKPEPRPQPKPRPAPKPAPSQSSDSGEQSRPNNNKPQTPAVTGTPTSPAAQLAFGNNGQDNNKPVEKSTPTPIPVVPTPQPESTPTPEPVEEIQNPQETQSNQGNQSNEGVGSSGLALDPPESVAQEASNAISVPPPEPLETPQETPAPEPEPEPEPVVKSQPAPVAQPAPRPQPAPAPAPQEDDSLFGLGLSIPVLGGIVAAILALIGGLIFLLRKRKNKDDDRMEEFTPEEINRMVEEMEKEHSDLDFDALSAEQEKHSDDAPIGITKLDPEYQPSSSASDGSSVDELSDDFFKDLEIPEAEDDKLFDSAYDNAGSTNDVVSDASELEDNFFSDLELTDGLEQASSTDNQDDFLSDFDLNTDESDDFSSQHFNNQDDSATTADSDGLDSLFDDLDIITDEDNNAPPPPAPKPVAAAAEDDAFDLDLFNTDDISEPAPPPPAPAPAENDSNSVDFDLFADDDTSSEPPPPPAPTLSKKSDDANSVDFDLFADDDASAAPPPPPKPAAPDAFAPPPPRGVVSHDPAPEEKDFFDENDDDLDLVSDDHHLELEKETPPAPTPAPPPPKPAAKPAAEPVIDAEAMEINLDMATSFMTMGKSEKARSWLEEVLESGTEEQKKRANEMLAKINKS